MNDLISVIIPIYKVEKYIHKCIDSVINQTYKNIEVLLVDDGSPDDCPQICDDYALKDSRVKTIHKKNGGLSDARNIGIKNSIGKYIAFVDGDDYIDKEYVEELYKAIILNDADLAICDFDKVDDNYKKINEKHSSFYNKTIENKEEAIAMSVNGGIRYITCWNKLYNRKLFTNITFPIGKYHEDEFIAHQILYECNRIVTIDKPLYKYVQHNNSIMNIRPIPIKRFDAVEALIERTFFLENNGYDKLSNECYKNVKKLYCLLKFSFFPKKDYDKQRIKKYDNDFFNLIYKKEKNQFIKYLVTKKPFRIFYTILYRIYIKILQYIK